MNPRTILSLAVALLALCDARAVDMTGEIVSQAGAPLSGATVMVLAAGPRSGSSPLCPYTYPDCGKQSLTDDGGHFRLPELDPAMDFYIIALAPGFEPGFNSALIPEKGPVKLKLRPRDLTKVPRERVVSGRIIGTAGEPVAGAKLSVEGLSFGDTTHWGGFKMDSMTISDLNGEFHLVAQQDLSIAHVLVTAPGRSPRWFQLAPAKVSLLRLKEGSAVKGRLVSDGRPLAGMPLSMVTTERECGKTMRDFNAVTDAEGRFVFLNVPAGEKMQLFGLMDAFKKNGASFRTDITVGGEAKSTELGEVAAVPAYRFSGRIVLADGKPVPAKTRLMLNREAAWDHQLIEIGEDGSFSTEGVPGEQIHLIVRVPGYYTSRKNPNLNIWDHSSLTGRIAGDIENMKIILEPGGRQDGAWADVEQPSYEAVQAAAKKPFQSAP